jgi:hypothetical protein
LSSADKNEDSVSSYSDSAGKDNEAFEEDEANEDMSTDAGQRRLFIEQIWEEICTSQDSSKQTTGKEKPEMNERNISWMCYAVAIVVVLVGCLCAAKYYSQKDTETVLPALSITASESKHEKLLTQYIKEVSDEFPSQHEGTWRSFSSGIKDVSKDPEKPAIFLLLHDTEEKTSACLAMKIGSIATWFLRATNSQPVVLDGVDLEHNETLTEDYGVLLEEYRSKVLEQRAMIVIDLHRIPGKVAQCFRTFCDVEVPLVGKAVYLFTMKASGVNHSSDRPTSLAEEELRKLWSGQVDEDALMPLITRITGMTMVIEPEVNIAC